MMSARHAHHKTNKLAHVPEQMEKEYAVRLSQCINGGELVLLLNPSARQHNWVPGAYHVVLNEQQQLEVRLQPQIAADTSATTPTPASSAAEVAAHAVATNAAAASVDEMHDTCNASDNHDDSEGSAITLASDDVEGTPHEQGEETEEPKELQPGVLVEAVRGHHAGIDEGGLLVALALLCKYGSLLLPVHGTPSTASHEVTVSVWLAPHFFDDVGLLDGNEAEAALKRLPWRTSNSQELLRAEWHSSRTQLLAALLKGLRAAGDAQSALWTIPTAFRPASLQAPAEQSELDRIYAYVLPSSWKHMQEDPPGLQCALYRYQQKALSWMMWREEEVHSTNEPDEHEGNNDEDMDVTAKRHSSNLLQAEEKRQQLNEVLPILPGVDDNQPDDPAWRDKLEHDLVWSRVQLQSGVGVCISSDGDGFEWPRINARPRDTRNAPSTRRGGILADEMGLGKTVEVISLMLARPHPAAKEVAALGAAERAAAAAHVTVVAATEAAAPIQQEDAAEVEQAVSEDDVPISQLAKRGKTASSSHGGSAGAVAVDMRSTGRAASRPKETCEHATADAAAAAMVDARTALKKAHSALVAVTAPLEGSKRCRGPNIVVCPPAILNQWKSELQRHCHLRVLVYPGLIQQQKEQQEARDAICAAASGTGSSRGRGRSHRRGQGRASVPGRGSGHGGRHNHAAIQTEWERLAARCEAAQKGLPADFDVVHAAKATTQEMLKVDVVLTTYQVLQEEVHFTRSEGQEARFSSLRHQKRYEVPDSPLLQIHWHRLFLDEAQMAASSASQVAQMARRMMSTYRWAVSGTPLGDGSPANVMALLQALQYSPWSLERGWYSFHRLITALYPDDPKGARHQNSKGARHRNSNVRFDREEGLRRMGLLLKPIMWRNSKAAVEEDQRLPPRKLQLALLAHSRGEKTLYGECLKSLKKVWRCMQQGTTAAGAAAATVEAIVEATEGSAAPGIAAGLNTALQPSPATAAAADAGSADLTAPAAAAVDGSQHAAALAVPVGVDDEHLDAAQLLRDAEPKRRRKARKSAASGQDTGVALSKLAARELLQLRMACIHPQLTIMGREMSHAGEEDGDVRTMAQMMSHVRDKAQLQLQSAERELCITLNALATKLTRAAARLATAAGRHSSKTARAVPTSPSAIRGKAKRKLSQAASPLSKSTRGGAAKVAKSSAVATAANTQIGAETAPPHGMAAAAVLPTGAGHGSDVEDPDSADEGGAGGPDHIAGDAVGAVSPASKMLHSTKGKTAAQLMEEAQQLQVEALQLLEESYRVGEKGIGAAEIDDSGFEELDNISANAASIRSWRFVQVHCCRMLADALQQAGRAAEAAKKEQELQGKMAELMSGEEAGFEKAQAKFQLLASGVPNAEARVQRDWCAALDAGLPADIYTLSLESKADAKFGPTIESGHTWLARVKAKLADARKLEDEQKAAAEAAVMASGKRETVQAALGTAVMELANVEQAAMQEGANHLNAALLMPTVTASACRVAEALMGCEAAADARNSDAGGSSNLASTQPWALEAQPQKALLWRLMLVGPSTPKLCKKLAQSLCTSLDVHSRILVGKQLRMVKKMLEDRIKVLGKTLANVPVQLQHLSPAVQLAALEVLQGRQELLRLYRDTHIAACGLEAKRFNMNELHSKVLAAAAGQDQQPKHSELDLQHMAVEGRKECQDLRSKRTFFHSQYLDAAGLRQTQPPAAPAAAAAAPPSAEAGVPITATPFAAPAAPPALPAATLETAVLQDRITTGLKASANAAQAFAELAGRERVPVISTSATAAAARSSPPMQAQWCLTCRCGVLHHTHLHGEVVGVAASLSHYKLCPQLHPSVPVHAAADVTEQVDVAEDVLMAEGVMAPVLPPSGPISCAAWFKQKQHKVEAPAMAGATACSSSAQASSSAAALTAADHAARPTFAAEAALAVPTLATALAAAGSAAAPGPAEEAAPAVPLAVPAQHQPQKAAAAGLGPADLVRTGSAGLLLTHAAVHDVEVEVEDGVESEHSACPICREQVSGSAHVFPCAHFLCDKCMPAFLASFQLQLACPVCRREVERSEIMRAKVGGPHLERPGTSAAAVQAAQAGQGGELDPPEGWDLLRIKVHGEWMTKIEALVRRLLWLRARSPGEKSLVFSQFPNALALLGKALSANDIGHVTLAPGRKAGPTIQAFLTDEEKHVFLINLKAGAAGLTLVRANNVFFLEPSEDPAIEQQAVGRVHRIGQTRPVVVTRLLVKDTVEMDVLKVMERKQRLFEEDGTRSAEQNDGDTDMRDQTEAVDSDKEAGSDISNQNCSPRGASGSRAQVQGESRLCRKRAAGACGSHGGDADESPRRRRKILGLQRASVGVAGSAGLGLQPSTLGIRTLGSDAAAQDDMEGLLDALLS